MSYLDRDTYGMYKDSDSEGPGPALMVAASVNVPTLTVAGPSTVLSVLTQLTRSDCE